MKIGFCILGIRNCKSHNVVKKMDSECGHCGFNLDEYYRRISDIEQNGLTQLNRDTRGYIVKKTAERR